METDISPGVVKILELKAGLIPASWQLSQSEREQQFVDILTEFFQISQPSRGTARVLTVLK